MDNPPTTTSSPRPMRRAMVSGLVALGVLAVPASAAAHHTSDQTRLVHTAQASPAVRFVGATSSPFSTIALDLVHGEVTGAGTTVTAVTAPPTTVPAPTTTTTAPPPPPRPAPAPAAPQPAVAAAPAPAASGAYGDPSNDATWDRLAQCEAGGNWARNSGNGYYGGLQFSLSTWHSVGGTGRPDQNSREVQIEMGRRLQARSGWRQWPACSRSLGYR